MRGFGGCFVCGKDHRARTTHSLEEETGAVNKLKAHHQQALLTVVDLDYVVYTAESGSSGEYNGDDGELQWIIQGKSDEYSDIA